MKKIILTFVLGLSLITLAFGEACPFSNAGSVASPLGVLPCFIPGFEKHQGRFTIWDGTDFQIPGETDSGNITLKLQSGPKVDQGLTVSYSYFTGCSNLQFQQHHFTVDLAGANSSGEISFSTDCTFTAVQALQKKYPDIDPNFYGGISIGVNVDGAIIDPQQYQVNIYQ